MNKKLEELRKKAQSHPFYQLSKKERALQLDEIVRYNDEKIPYVIRIGVINELKLLP